jgi:hypothetical protein
MGSLESFPFVGMGAGLVSSTTHFGGEHNRTSAMGLALKYFGCAAELGAELFVLFGPGVLRIRNERLVGLLRPAWFDATSGRALEGATLFAEQLAERGYLLLLLGKPKFHHRLESGEVVFKVNGFY